MLGVPTQILIWGPKELKVLPDKLRVDLELWYQGGPKILGGGAMNPNDAMIRYNRQMIYSWSGRPKTILEIRKKATFFLLFTSFSKTLLTTEKRLTGR